MAGTKLSTTPQLYQMAIQSGQQTPAAQLLRGLSQAWEPKFELQWNLHLQ